jgi:hypothetical protein
VAKEPFIVALQEACLSARRAGTAAEKNRGAEDSFFRVASELETFLSQWLIRCVSIDSSTFAETSERRASNAAKDLLWSDWLTSKRLWTRKDDLIVTVDFALGRKLRLEKAMALLGREDDNFTFGGAADFKRNARELLAPAYADRLAMLSDRNDRILDATVAIRNVIAHRSDRAVQRMNQVLSSAHLPQGVRRSQNVGRRGVGYYLRTEGGAQRPRFEVFFDDLAEIAHILAPKRGRRPVICP